MKNKWIRILALLAALTLFAAACASDTDDTAAPATDGTEPAAADECETI